MIDHDGWYNPWDELKKPDVRRAADEAIASGGYVFRTGVCHTIPGKVAYGRDGTITIGAPSFRY